MTEWYIQNWLSDTQIDEIQYSEYWNDENKEKNKEWYVLDEDFSKMEYYLEKIGLPSDLETCIEVLYTHFDRQLSGIGIDLAAGNLWAAPHLLKFEDVTKLYSLELSKHRIFKIGPMVLDHYGVPKEKIVLSLGSFYDLQVDKQFFDFVFMSQAFHHADDPERLLEEICRVLKPNGIVIIIGEHIINWRKAQIKHVARFVVSRFFPETIQVKLFGKVFETKQLVVTSNEICPPDSILGDHYYRDDEYKNLFSRYGFQVKQIKRRDSHFQSFVLVLSH